MNFGRSLVAVCMAVVAASAGAWAQAPAPAAPDAVAKPAQDAAVGGNSGWVFNLSAYMWATSLAGNVRTLPLLPETHVNVPFSDILRNLDGALMASGEARKDRFMIFTDLVLSRVSPSKGFDVRDVRGQAKLDSISDTGLLSLGYRVYDDERFTFDAMAGARAFYVSNDLSIAGIHIGDVHVPGISLKKSEAWVDPVIGFRARIRLAEQVHLLAIGFYGGFNVGSRQMIDMFGGLEYKLTSTYSAFLGYRSMLVDYRRGSFVYDVNQYGPMFGIRAQF